jgi:uncharacterized damage-inducible protein DinB
MSPLRTYDYLIKSRERVLGAIRPLTAQQYARDFPIGLGSIGSTLTHMMISEWYYVERLQGRPVPPYEQWPIKYEHPPAFETVEAAWREQMTRIRSLVAAERDWSRVVTWDSFADDQGRRFRITATSGDVLTQLVLHEVHHRAQIMAMLRGLGDSVPPLQDIDYSELMYGRQAID